MGSKRTLRSPTCSGHYVLVRMSRSTNRSRQVTARTISALGAPPATDGGTFTDWDQVPDWHDIGYPIAECAADGSFVLSKPAGTGGLIIPGVVAEQTLYEIGDPAAYLLPDVVADFSEVRLTQIAPDVVRVEGARGRAPGGRYKIANDQDLAIARSRRFRSSGPTPRARPSAPARLCSPAPARAFPRAGSAISRRPILRRSAPRRPIARSRGRAPRARCCCASSSNMRAGGARNLRARTGLGRADLRARHDRHLQRPTQADAGRAPVHLLHRQGGARSPRVTIGDAAPVAVAVPTGGGEVPPAPARAAPTTSSPTADRRDAAARFAYARSGDKGNASNIAIIAREPRFLPLLRREVTSRGCSPISVISSALCSASRRQASTRSTS